MASRETITVERMDAAGAVRVEGELRRVYAEVFAEPPYEETAEGVEAGLRRFHGKAGEPGFRAALARDGDGEPVGMAYGYALGARNDWWDRMVEPVPEALSREDGGRTFGLMELAVRARWRRFGVGRRLHDALTEGAEEERMLLNMWPEARAALAAYRRWGYRKVGEARAGDSGFVLDVMVLELPPGAA
ncbi:GNAT family N-acetyltransferase [Streptomyces sp. NPDC014894]|uniref:GNAT family N-acetyltransferase n=1 Tax=unclassified Streptomyces TaxID=2593676 RepID=UPI0036FF1218